MPRHSRLETVLMFCSGPRMAVSACDVGLRKLRGQSGLASVATGNQCDNGMALDEVMCALNWPRRFPGDDVVG